MENKETIRDSISDLLAENDINIDDDIQSQTLTFERTPSTIENNAYMGLEKCKQKAEKVMSSLLKLYMTEGFISKSEYVQAKSNLDAMTLGRIMNQMEVSERAINVLMANIELGEVNSKLFDALGNLQRTFVDLVKTQNNYIMTAQNEYEKISLDKDAVIEVASTAEVISSGYKSSNEKDLMRLIRTTVDKG